MLNSRKEKGIIYKVKNRLMGKISNILRSAVRREIEEALPIVSQFIKFQISHKEERASYYDHTKKPAANIKYYAGLKDRLIDTGITVEEVAVDIADFNKMAGTFSGDCWLL